ncbi:unnamed protein product [Closterium sp. NIES-65]|nr:unnamed protein product [Closterium sp. NIES-65]
MKPVLTRKGLTMRPAEEGDAVMGTYRTALGDLMDALPGSMVAAKITASEVVAHTAVAIPRNKGGALVPKGAFIKASPKEKWLTDFAVPLGTSVDEREQLSREWHMPVCFVYNATGCVRKPPIVVLRRDDKRPVHEGRKKNHDVKVRYAKNGCFSSELFTEFVDELNGELHAKNEKAVVLVHNPSHTLTGCVKRTSTVEGFVVKELTRVKVVQTFGVMPAAAFSAINGVVDTLKAVFRTWFRRTAVTSTEWTRAGIFPRPPLHEVLYKLFMACKLTMPGTIQRSWWRAGSVPKGWLSRMGSLKGKAAAGMFDGLVVQLTSLQLVIEELKGKCSSTAFMTAWDFVGCDEGLIDKWAPARGLEDESEDEIPAYFCIPEGPLMRDSRSYRRVSRMVHDGFVKQAEALGIPPRDVPEEAGVVNEEVVSRLRRTPTKRNRTGRSSDEGITSDASDEAGQSRKAGVLFRVEDDKESVVRLV